MNERIDERQGDQNKTGNRQTGQSEKSSQEKMTESGQKGSQGSQHDGKSASQAIDIEK